MQNTHHGRLLGTLARRTRGSIAGTMLGVACAASALAQPSGTLVQWGASSLDQRQNQPVLAGPYKSIAAGQFFNIALKEDGSLVQWGSASDRQSDNLPPAAGPYSQIAAGASHGLALTTVGSLVQWGRLWDGQAIGQPPTAGPYKAIAAGFYHNVAIKADGTLVQWGDTSVSQRNGFPTDVGTYIAISAGATHTLALRADGSLVQWGNTSSDQAVGAPPAAGPYIAIAAGTTHSLALRADGSLVQWGDNFHGQLDNPPPLAGPYVAIAAGSAHNMALKADGTLVQWGRTNAGQLNDAPSFAGPFRTIVCGGYHSLAITGMPTSPGSFTYQGRLSGATGPVDLRLGLFNAPSGGSPVGLTTVAPSVTPASNGVFTVTVNPGLIDASQPLWLEIGVAEAGSGSYTTLSPRQPLTATPQALYATRAGIAQLAYTAETAKTATTALTAANATNAANAANATNATNAVNATTANSAATVQWSGVTGVPANVANAFSPWASGGGGIISYSGGSVGIGTTTPVARLDVAGGPIGTGWLTRFINTAVVNAGFRVTGMRVSDDGFFEVSNSVAAGAPNFARLAGNGAWTAVSDARLKTDVTPDDPAEMLAAALKLRPVHFVWKRSSERDAGLIAQEVRDVLPDLVTGDESRGVLTVDYSKVGVVAVGAIQEQQKKINRLEAENRTLRERLERIEAAIRDGATKR
ncbi:MAG TPA: tail fiber domain-containing protein [Phycisphaerales bacterium]